MSQHTRRQFIGSVGSVAATTVLVPGALAAGRPAPGIAQSAQASPPAAPSSYYTYQSEIYLRGMAQGQVPKITTNLVQARGPSRQGARPPGPGVLPGRRGRRGGRARECESVSGLADHPADVHRPGGARPVHDHPRDAHAGAGHLRAGGAPEAGSCRRGTGQRPRRRGLELTYIQSARASYSIEEVAAANGEGSRWYQMDWPRDGDLNLSSLRRARAAGYTHLLITAPRARPKLEAAAADPQELGRPDPPAGSPDRDGREARGQAPFRRHRGLQPRRPPGRPGGRVGPRPAEDRRRRGRSARRPVRFRRSYRHGHLQGTRPRRGRRPRRPPLRLRPCPGRAGRVSATSCGPCWPSSTSTWPTPATEATASSAAPTSPASGPDRPVTSVHA